MATRVPTIKALVVSDSDESIEFTSGVAIEVTTASYRTVRGRTVLAALLDEVAFWRDDTNSVNPDSEIVTALRPAMSTIPGSILVGASSPYAKRGVLWDAYRKHWAQSGPALVWKAPTRTMNPLVPADVIDAEMERDPARASAEFLAEFRTDIDSFVTREVIDAATVPGRFELPPLSDTRYCAFVDPSGGSADSMTLAIAHAEDDRAVLDLLREVRPPFSPEAVTKEFAQTIQAYDLHEVEGDRYGGEWPRERFSEHGVRYVPADKAKSDIYKELLPLLNSGKAELLDLPRLGVQFASLERRTARGGRDSVDHPPGAHDDAANAAAGALVSAISGRWARTIWERLD